jgi:hypothetical protein
MGSLTMRGLPANCYRIAQLQPWYLHYSVTGCDMKSVVNERYHVAMYIQSIESSCVCMCMCVRCTSFFSCFSVTLLAYYITFYFEMFQIRKMLTLLLLLLAVIAQAWTQYWTILIMSLILSDITHINQSMMIHDKMIYVCNYCLI